MTPYKVKLTDQVQPGRDKIDIRVRPGGGPRLRFCRGVTGTKVTEHEVHLTPEQARKLQGFEVERVKKTANKDSKKKEGS